MLKKTAIWLLILIKIMFEAIISVNIDAVLISKIILRKPLRSCLKMTTSEV